MSPVLAPSPFGGVTRTMFTVDELAERWNIDRKTLYLMIQRKEIQARRFGRAVRIPRAVVESYESQGSVVAEGK